MNDKNSPRSELSQSGQNQEELDFSNDIMRISIDPLESARGCFTDDDIEEAVAMTKLIIEKVNRFTRIGFEIAQLVYNFRERKLWQRLGYNSFNNWLLGSGLPRSTIYRYLQIYEYFTIKVNIPINEYSEINVGKLRQLHPLIKAGANTNSVRQILEDARSYDLESLTVHVEETIESINRDKDPEKKIENELDRYSIPEEEYIPPAEQLLAAGLYKLIYIETEPTSQRNLVKQKGYEKVESIRKSLFYNREKNEFFIWIK